MSTFERKRSLSAAFEHPASPARKAKTTKIASPASKNKENEAPPPQDHGVEAASSPVNVNFAPHIPASPMSRGIPLQELTEIPSSGGLLRPKMTLDDDDSVDHEAVWEPTPFVIWEDVDVAVERMSFEDEEM
jgi:hypothetical protein